MKNFYVLQPHVSGTTVYAIGDRREADENDVQHLVELGVLGDKKPDVLQESAEQTFNAAASNDVAALAAQLTERNSFIDRLSVDVDQLRSDHAQALQGAQDRFDAELADANARADDALAKVVKMEDALADITARAEAAETKVAELQKAAASGKAGK